MKMLDGQSFVERSALPLDRRAGNRGGTQRPFYYIEYGFPAYLFVPPRSTSGLYVAIPFVWSFMP